MMSDVVGVSLVTQQTTDKDELFICPFDPVHRISAKRFVYHIVKCRKQHPHLETATCPFNARHIVLKPELRHHTSICPDKKLLELELHSCDVTELSNDQRAVSNEDLDFGGDEDWDAEIERNRNLKPIDPFASNSVDYCAPKTQSTFSENAGAKKVNSRREAIKKIKERMRQEAKDNDELKMRRPYFDVNDHDNLPSMYARTHGHSVHKSISNHKTVSNGVDTVASVKKSATQTKLRPRLAPNFNMEPKQPSFAIGRGRFFQEMRDSTERANKKPGSIVPLSGSTFSNPALISNDNKTNEALQVSDVDWGQDELQKKERKLTKLLKQIDALERELASGVVLNAEQNSKLRRKEEIVQSLQLMRKQQMLFSK